ncbi:MAG: hypothetical protein NTY35_15795 [Planctomycetota bacterium]|nr:hypothetical protein [Planctomycetota bacterium]
MRTEQRPYGTSREPWIALACGLLVLIPYALVHLRWLPGPDGLVGHDWSYVLPRLLAGAYWIEQNGPLEVPWFTPAFNGGTPFFAHPANAYASVLQLLVQFVGPIAAAQAVLVGGAAVGYVGTWLLARRALGASNAASILAATIFAWSGFHATRMLVGHAGFHSSVLVPLAAYWILRPVDPARRTLQLARDGALAGLVVAYMLLSGNVYGLPPAVLAVTALACVHALRSGSARDAAWRAAIALAAGLLMCGAKLWAGFAFLGNAPRTGYPLPGFDGIVTGIVGVARCLFLRVPVNGADAGVVNSRYALGGHELDFGVTWIPVVLFVLWSAHGSAPWRERARALRKRPIAAALCALVLAVPFAVNVHGESWTAFLKSLPVLSSSSNLLRWLWTYVPLAAIAAALASDGIRASERRRAWLAAVACAAVVLLSALADPGARIERVYDPARIESAARALRGGADVVPIRRNNVVWNERGEPTRPIGRDDLLAAGASQLLAYEPLFGYDLEWFPMGTLHPGDPFEATGDELNFKDPASFVFPARNGGKAGSHFRRDDRERLAAFLDYRAIEWSKPPLFPLVSVVGPLTLVTVLLAIALIPLRWRKRG